MPTIQVKDAIGAVQTINNIPPLGQALSSNSSPVVIASDQVVNVVVTNSQAGVATSAKQDAQETTLQTLALETGGNLATIATAQGVAGTGIAQPTGGSGKLGFLSGIWNKLNTSIAVTATALPLPAGAALENGGNLAAILAKLISAPATAAKQDAQAATLSTLALEAGNLATLANALGTAGTGIAQPTGGSGKLGWLSGIYQAAISALPSGENHIGSATGLCSLITASFTRTSATTSYQQLQAVSDSAAVLPFTNIARVNGGSGYIVKARLVTNNINTAARFRLHLYTVAPAVVPDYSLYPNFSANKANKVGYIDFDATGIESTGYTGNLTDIAESLNSAARLCFVCAASSRTLYGALQCRDGFTPIASQTFFIELTSEQN